MRKKIGNKFEELKEEQLVLDGSKVTAYRKGEKGNGQHLEKGKVFISTSAVTAFSQKRR